MSTATTYKFSTFQELVDRVPTNRICDCMHELGLLLASTKGSVEVAYLVACNLAKERGEEPKPEPASLVTIPSEFEWVDDGLGRIQSNLCDSKGERIYTVNLELKRDKKFKRITCPSCGKSVCVSKKGWIRAHRYNNQWCNANFDSKQ